MEADLVDIGVNVFTELVKPEGGANSANKAIAEFEI